MGTTVGRQTQTIWVLDDNSSVLKATSRLITSAGWPVEPFSDPTVFLRRAETERPTVTVIDVVMPAMDGLEVQKRLRAVSPTTRVIFFSSNDEPGIRSEALNAGAFAFLMKLVPDEQLFAAIEAALTE